MTEVNTVVVAARVGFDSHHTLRSTGTDGSGQGPDGTTIWRCGGQAW